MPCFVAYGSVVAEVCITSIYPEAINIYENSFEVQDLSLLQLSGILRFVIGRKLRAFRRIVLPSIRLEVFARDNVGHVN